MNVALFCHSFVSDWNHGNAHFLRGIASELRARGHRVACYEPADAWSVVNLLEEDPGRTVADHLRELARRYPHLDPERYRLDALDLEAELDDVDVVLVHEWNDPELVRRLGAHRRHCAYTLLFHDTHHRAVTDPAALDRLCLDEYDGVLAFGDALGEVYERRGWGRRVWTWHEAADVRVFAPQRAEPEGDLVWIGNWGDEERTRELHEFLLGPVGDLGLRAVVHGVRYPPQARRAVARSGAALRGWL
ncbi:MAG TPA: hypothetical protein VFQ22_10380, partial [Longimicrobiales bacterium]|nr:hypothetical protein [Longimicrobiales bacterium]